MPETENKPVRRDAAKINEIMEHAARNGNRTPKPERVSAEVEREKLLGRMKQK